MTIASLVRFVLAATLALSLGSAAAQDTGQGQPGQGQPGQGQPGKGEPHDSRGVLRLLPTYFVTEH